MKLPDNVYNFLKWLCLLALPALATFYGIVGQTWDIPYTDKICTTITAIATFIGILIGVSHYKIKKEQEDNAEEDEANG